MSEELTEERSDELFRRYIADMRDSIAKSNASPAAKAALNAITDKVEEFGGMPDEEKTEEKVKEFHRDLYTRCAAVSAKIAGDKRGNS